MQRPPIRRFRLRFRQCVLIVALLLTITLYLVIHQDRLDGELTDAVMQGDAARVHAALLAGANAKRGVWKATQPGPLERLLRGENPFVNVAAPEPDPRSAKRFSNEHTLLMYAAESGSVDILNDLIEHGAPIERRLSNGNTVLFLCTGRGNNEALEALIRHGADVNVRNDDGRTPLHVAAASNSVDAVRLLLNGGADPMAWDAKRASPLAVAARARAAEACLLLLEHGAAPQDLRFADSTGAPPLGVNVYNGGLRAAASTPLAWASARGSLPLVRRLWESILAPDERRAQADEALYEAALAKRLDVAAYLLNRGVSPNPRPMPVPSALSRNAVHGAQGGTRPPVARIVVSGAQTRTLSAPAIIALDRPPAPLSAAAANRDVKMCALLLAHGAAIAGDRWGGDPLTAAVQAEAVQAVNSTPFGRGSVSNPRPAGKSAYPTVRFLLAKGADVNGAGSFSGVPLSAAAHDPNLVDLLLKRGADARRRSPGGRTPLMAACGSNSKSVAELLAAGADPNERDRQGTTPLMLAVNNFPSFDVARTVRLLLKHGADPNARDAHGQTAFVKERRMASSMQSPGRAFLNPAQKEIEALLKQAAAHTLVR
jgi:ankyrin repeat protein